MDPKLMTFEQKVALFRETAHDANKRAEFMASRAEVLLPLLDEQSTIRSIFRVEPLAPGATPVWDIPFEDINCVWVMPHIGGIPTIQVEGAQMSCDTFGLDAGVEWQLDIAKDGRFQVAQLATTLLKNKFIKQEEQCGWALIKAHAAVLPTEQKVTAVDKDGGTTGTKQLNIFTLNEVITTADEIGIGGRRVTDIYCSPRRFNDFRQTIGAGLALPDSLKTTLYGGGDGPGAVSGIRIHKVYSKDLVADNRAYAFTQKDGYYYGVMPIRETLNSRDNPVAILEWKQGVIARERLGFGVLDSKGLIEITI